VTFDPSSYLPEPNEWLGIPTEHRGRAKLRFRDPAGSVEGDAKLSVDETGEVRIEVKLDPATLDVESSTGEGLLPFIWPSRSKVVDGRRVTIRSFGDELNPCSRLEIETHEGLLATEDVDDYSHHEIIGDGRDELRLEFEPRFGSAFDIVGAGQPTYWALPLLNFVSRFPQRGPTTDRHPLRVYPTPVVPDDLPEEEREAAVDAANEHNRLILFEFAGRPGFVERLAGYEEREEALRQGSTRSAATAVVVGEIGDRDPQDLENSFPSDVAALLSLASGTEVSAPTIEFRDEEGRLVRRVHYHLSPSQYLEGHRPIRDRLASGRSLRETMSRPQ
jgi:hypothetical protein